MSKTTYKQRETERLAKLEAEKSELLELKTTCMRRLSELEPKHKEQRWMGHRHPEDQRSYEDLSLWRNNIDRRLMWLERDISVAKENLVDCDPDAEWL